MSKRPRKKARSKKTEVEIQEDEELQLALALSMSEATEKEKQGSRPPGRDHELHPNGHPDTATSDDDVLTSTPETPTKRRRIESQSSVSSISGLADWFTRRKSDIVNNYFVKELVKTPSFVKAKIASLTGNLVHLAGSTDDPRAAGAGTSQATASTRTPYDEPGPPVHVVSNNEMPPQFTTSTPFARNNPMMHDERFRVQMAGSAPDLHNAPQSQSGYHFAQARMDINQEPVESTTQQVAATSAGYMDANTTAAPRPVVLRSAKHSSCPSLYDEVYRGGSRRESATGRRKLTATNSIQLDEKEKYQKLLSSFSKTNFNFTSKPSTNSMQTKPSDRTLLGSVSSHHSAMEVTGRSQMSISISSNASSHISVRSSDSELRQNGGSSIFSSQSGGAEPPRPHVAPTRSLPSLKFGLSDQRERQHQESKYSDWVHDLRKKFSSEVRRKVRDKEEAEEIRMKYLERKLSEGLRLTEEEFPELSEEQEAAVDWALRPHPGGEVLVEGFKLQITRNDMATLAGLNWLNDEVINFYMNMLMERGRDDNMPSVHAFNTFFYPKVMSTGHQGVRRWTKQVDLFSMDYILIPVHLDMHWCLAVIDLRNEEIRYYDSMGGENDPCLNTLTEYLEDESMDKKKKTFDASGFKLINVKNIPMQMNGSDCGMFTCKFAEYVTRDAEITFSQEHMPYFRRRIVYEILTKTLL